MSTRHDSALSLLTQVTRLESSLLEFIARADAARTLEPLAWEEVETGVLLPGWEATAAEQRRALSGLVASALPVGPAALDRFAGKLVLPPDAKPSHEDLRGYAGHVLAAALVSALVRSGFRVSAQPGEAILCERGSARVEPFAVVAQLGAGELDADAWLRQCTSGGFADLALEPPATAGAGSAA